MPVEIMVEHRDEDDVQTGDTGDTGPPAIPIIAGAAMVRQDLPRWRYIGLDPLRRHNIRLYRLHRVRRRVDVEHRIPANNVYVYDMMNWGGRLIIRIF